jgi:hypothetical protein
MSKGLKGLDYNYIVSKKLIWESTKTYRRSKRASKRVEVPNLAQAAK